MMAMNYIEIYNEQIRDLLSDVTKKVYIKENPVNGDPSVEVRDLNLRNIYII